MTIQETISKAIEGGWKNRHLEDEHQKEVYFDAIHRYPRRWMNQLFEEYPSFLDPSFWQSLGKSLGWDMVTCFRCLKKYHVPLTDLEKQEVNLNVYCKHDELRDYEEKWKREWHNFIEYLARNKSIESYFENL